MANYQAPRVPEFARDLDPSILQLHSHEYRNPGQLQEGGVLVVGVGNSGADIAIEVARAHPTWISGTESGHIPVRIDSWIARNVVVRFVRFLGHHVLNVNTPVGRKLRPKLLAKASPLVRVKPKDLVDAGIERVPRVAGVKSGLPMLAGGRLLDVQNVIWCTGYQHAFPWIDLPVFGEDHQPVHERGIVEKVPGLYFVGLHFLYSMSSATLIGVGRDAERVVKVLAQHTKPRMARKSASAASGLVYDPCPLNQPVVVSIRRGRRPRRQVHLVENVAQVARHGLLADLQLPRNRPVRQPGSHQPQDLNLPLGQGPLLPHNATAGIRPGQFHRRAEPRECFPRRSQFHRRILFIPQFAARRCDQQSHPCRLVRGIQVTPQVPGRP